MRRSSKRDVKMQLFPAVTCGRHTWICDQADYVLQPSCPTCRSSIYCPAASACFSVFAYFNMSEDVIYKKVLLNESFFRMIGHCFCSVWVWVPLRSKMAANLSSSRSSSELDSRQILTSLLGQNSFQPEKTRTSSGLRSRKKWSWWRVDLPLLVCTSHSFERMFFCPSAWPLFPGLRSSHSHSLNYSRKSIFFCITSREKTVQSHPAAQGLLLWFPHWPQDKAKLNSCPPSPPHLGKWLFNRHKFSPFSQSFAQTLWGCVLTASMTSGNLKSEHHIISHVSRRGHIPPAGY